MALQGHYPGTAERRRDGACRLVGAAATRYSPRHFRVAHADAKDAPGRVPEWSIGAVSKF
jgi:hypothetical protein